MRRVVVGAVLALMVAATLTGCASSSSDDDTGANEATTTSTTEAGGPFDFTAQTLDGGSLDGESLKGKDVVLWFWAPWCPTCLVEGKDQVAAALAEIPEGVEFVGIAGRSDDLDEMQEFLDWTGTGPPGITHVADVDGSIWAGFQVALQPAFYFVNQDGTFRRAGSGLNTEDLVSEMELLLEN